MKNNKLKTILLAFTILLSACGGNGSSILPEKEHVAIRKTINTDNLEQVLSTYLLYRYRVAREFELLMGFRSIATDYSVAVFACPLNGSVQSFNALRFIFNNCQTAQGKIFGGSIIQEMSIGPLHNSSLRIFELNYQLTDDTELQKLSGDYRYASSSQPNSFTWNYVRGTRTESYSGITGANVMINTTGIDSNQNFKLAEYDDKNLPIAPILSADDGSNLSIVFDSAGTAYLSLRNDKDSAVLANKVFSKAEVDKLLAIERKAKS